jgi:hypothetical protein
MTATLFGWLGFSIVAGSMALWFWKMQRVEIPENRGAFVAAWVIGALLGLVAVVQDAGWVGEVPGVTAAIAGLFFTALFFISPQKTSTARLSTVRASVANRS